MRIENVNASEDSDLWPGSDAAVRGQNQTPEESAIPDTRGKPAAGISEHDKNQSHHPWAESGGEETQRLSVNWSFKPVIFGHEKDEAIPVFWLNVLSHVEALVAADTENHQCTVHCPVSLDLWRQL